MQLESGLDCVMVLLKGFNLLVTNLKPCSVHNYSVPSVPACY